MCIYFNKIKVNGDEFMNNNPRYDINRESRLFSNRQNEYKETERNKSMNEINTLANKIKKESFNDELDSMFEENKNENNVTLQFKHR